MTSIPVSVFDQPDLRLRVWFNDGVNGVQLLSPDSRITPNGYLPDAAVNSSKLAPNLTLAGTTTGTFSGDGASITNLIPVGSVMAFMGTTAPSGWLLCDGSTVSRTTYANLYSTLGNACGSGDGSTTFHLPDMRGMFLRGVSGATSVDPDRMSRTAIADSRFGGLYSISVDTTDQGGGRSQYGSLYSIDASMGQVPGTATTSSPDLGVRNSFVGQVYDAVSIQTLSNFTHINESTGTAQLSATVGLDDGTALLLLGSDLGMNL